MEGLTRHSSETPSLSFEVRPAWPEGLLVGVLCGIPLGVVAGFWIVFAFT